MTFIYTPPEPTAFIAEVRLWPSGKQHKMTFRGFTEAQLRSEVERVRRETVEACAKHFDAMPGREMFGDAIADEIKELLK